MFSKMDFKQKSKYFWLITVVALFVISRLLIMFHMRYMDVMYEEYFSGTLAKGILGGWMPHPLDFQVRPYNGGSVVNALLLIPFFFLFGPYVICLKLAAILVHSLGLVLMFSLCCRYFSRRVALVSCAFYILSPPLFIVRTLEFCGAHSEITVLILLIFYIFFDILYGKPSGRTYILLGIVSGLSLWYSYLSLVAVITCHLLWLLKDRRFFMKKSYFFYLVSCAIGLLPWVLYNAGNKFIGLDIARYNFDWAHAGSRNFVFFKKLWDLLVIHGPKMFAFENSFGVIYYMIFVSAFLYAAYRIGKSLLAGQTLFDERTGNRSAALLLFPLVYVLVFSFSRLGFDPSPSAFLTYRYAVPLFPFIYMIIALGIGRMLASSKKIMVAAGISLTGALCCMGILGSAGLMSPENLSSSYLFSKGYRYGIIGTVIFRKYGFDIEKLLAVTGKIKNEDMFVQSAYIAYGQEAGREFSDIRLLNKGLDNLKTMPTVWSERMYVLGLGRGVASIVTQRHEQWVVGVSANSLRTMLLMLDQRLGVKRGNFFYYGLYDGICTYDYMKAEEPFPHLSFVKALNGRCLKAFYFLYGRYKGRIMAENKIPVDLCRASDPIDPAYREYFNMGLGGGMAVFSPDGKYKAAALFQGCPDQEKESFLRGAGVCLHMENNFAMTEDVRDRFIAGLGEYKKYYDSGWKNLMEIFDSE